MTAQTTDPAIAAFIQQVIHLGSAYDLDGMEELYTADQSILFLDRAGQIVRSDRAAVLAEFRSRRDAGEAPLSTEHRLLHIEQQDDTATALLYRRMSPKAQPALYELRLRKADGTWKVAGETVLPWPNLAEAGDFLPPRALGAG
jgi:ketosteroid isomerase-like protein